MNKVKLFLLTTLATIVTLLASVSAASACALFHYQPPLPKKLAK
ncbi:MAG: cyclic lactone autoinducer peptide [Syntrophomonadaceae bacterium]|nr:cyclic lactone autoinducer peptide [Syntrophomonadaceae bacterium]